jgi:F420-dependent oxidoreductase-like protein
MAGRRFLSAVRRVHTPTAHRSTRKDTDRMAITYSLGLPQGFVGELTGRTDPADAFDALLRWTRAAEASGYDTVWVADHLMTVPPSQEMLFECWTMVVALLRETETLRIGQLATCNSYRNPALQAKMASSTDVIGGGRFTFGIGAGWYEPDYQAYGFEFPGAGERLRRLEEAVQIIGRMWTEDEVTFEGAHHQVRGAVNQPKGVQRPRIPMMIAGGGEKVTLRLVAAYGDYANVTGGPAEVERKFGILRKHCEDAGRDYDSIRRTVLMHAVLDESDEKAAARLPNWIPAVFPGDFGGYGLVGTADTVRDRIAAYEAAGVQEFVLSFPDTLATGLLREFAETFVA